MAAVASPDRRYHAEDNDLGGGEAGIGEVFKT